MHREDGHAGVDHLHAVFSEDIGDRTAAARADAAELAGLEGHAGLVHDVADEREVLGVGVVGTALAARARELVEAQAVAHDGGILLLKAVGVELVEPGGNVGGEHAARGEATAERQRALEAREGEHLGHGVLEETARHTGCAHRADLFLVAEQAYARALDLGHRELRGKGGVGADAVVLAIP